MDSDPTAKRHDQPAAWIIVHSNHVVRPVRRLGAIRLSTIFVLSSPRRGCRRYYWELLRVERMRLWLEELAKIMYGLVDTIATEGHVPESVPS